MKNTFDPNAIFDFLNHHPVHCEALYDVSEFFRLKGDYKNANELLERLLYIYEESIGYYFNQVIDNTIPTTELEINPYSKTLFMTLFKFTDILAKKGCYRTALE